MASKLNVIPTNISDNKDRGPADMAKIPIHVQLSAKYNYM